MVLGTAAHLLISNHQVIIYHKITCASVSIDMACPRTKFNRRKEVFLDNAARAQLGAELQCLPRVGRDDVLQAAGVCHSILPPNLGLEINLAVHPDNFWMKTMKMSIINSVHYCLITESYKHLILSIFSYVALSLLILVSEITN